MNEPTVSPGCYLAVITTPFLGYYFFTVPVIVSKGQSTPANVLQRIWLDIKFFLNGSTSRAWISF